MDADLDTLATALYVKIDDLLMGSPDRAPWRPQVGLKPQISDAELTTLCVMKALLSSTSEARWLRHARSPAASVPVPAAAVGLQQAAAQAGGYGELAELVIHFTASRRVSPDWLKCAARWAS